MDLRTAADRPAEGAAINVTGIDVDAEVEQRLEAAREDP
jgi:hypothetical protein